MSNDIIPVAGTSGTTGFTPEQMHVITSHIAKGATETELQYFLAVSKRLGLDPFGRQIYFVKRWDTKAQAEVGTVQISIDGFRVIAARTGLHAGTDDPVFDREDGEHPDRATVTVYRLVKGTRYAFPATARWSEYVQTYRDRKTGQETTAPMWRKMPYLMLGKVAESLALRRAFPEYLSGVYTSEEMGQVENGEMGEPDEREPRDESITVIPVPSAAGGPVSQETLFYIRMILEAVNPDPVVVTGWLKRNFGKERISDLTEAEAKKMTALLEEKYGDRIEKAGVASSASPVGTEKTAPHVVPEGPDGVRDVPAPEGPSEVKNEGHGEAWLHRARSIDSRADADALLEEMRRSGAEAYKIKAVSAILTGRTYADEI